MAASACRCRCGEHLVQPVHRALVERAERVGVGGTAQPRAQHLGVAGRAEDAGQPAQLVAQRAGPGLAQQRLEGAQVTAQASAGDPHLVHGGVATGGRGAQPDQRVVRQQPADSLRTASVTTSPALGSAVSPAGATRSGSACAVAPSARTCFGVNAPPARRPRAAPADPVEQLPVAGLVLHLHLAERAGGGAGVVEHGHPVVHHLGEHRAGLVTHLVRVPHRPHHRHRGQRRPPVQDGDQLHQLRRRLPLRPGREISCRTPGVPVGSFTVQGSSSPRRWRSEAPARASRRSTVSR